MVVYCPAWSTILKERKKERKNVGVFGLPWEEFASHEFCVIQKCVPFSKNRFFGIGN